MIALAKHTQQQNTVLKSDLALTANLPSALPLEPVFVRESTVETYYSSIVATLKGILTDVPDNQAVFLTLRVKHGNDIAIAYLPHLYQNEKFSIPAQGQWNVAEGDAVTLELIASCDCVLRGAEAEILCIDAPKPAANTDAAISRDSESAVARDGSASTPTMVICAPVIILEGTTYIGFLPGSQPGRVAVTLVNGE